MIANMRVMRIIETGGRVPRYFFHISGDGVGLDTEGTVLDSVDVARVEAVALAGQILRDAPLKFLSAGDLRIEVAGEDGIWLFSFVAVGLGAPTGSTAQVEKPDRLH